jgi:hypothetical protein
LQLDKEGGGAWVRKVHTFFVQTREITADEKLVIFCDRGYDNQAIPDELRRFVEVQTPASPAAGNNILTADEWEATRRVTKWRNVIECYLRRLQEFKLLRDHIPNKILPKLNRFVQVVATLQAMWREPLRSWPTDARRQQQPPPGPAPSSTATARDDPDSFFASHREKLAELLPGFRVPLTYKEVIATVSGTPWKELDSLPHLDSIWIEDARLIDAYHAQLTLSMQRAHSAARVKATLQFRRRSANAAEWYWDSEKQAQGSLTRPPCSCPARYARSSVLFRS